jgi:hypothetical protein
MSLEMWTFAAVGEFGTDSATRPLAAGGCDAALGAVACTCFSPPHALARRRAMAAGTTSRWFVRVIMGASV